MENRCCVHCGKEVLTKAGDIALCEKCGAPVRGDKLRQSWIKTHAEAFRRNTRCVDILLLKAAYENYLGCMRTQINFRGDWEMLFGYEAALRPFGFVKDSIERN